MNKKNKISHICHSYLKLTYYFYFFFAYIKVLLVNYPIGYNWFLWLNCKAIEFLFLLQIVTVIWVNAAMSSLPILATIEQL
jgi:hypothetical protein